jgi:hypothetical protein
MFDFLIVLGCMSIPVTLMAVGIITIMERS